MTNKYDIRSMIQEYDIRIIYFEYNKDVIVSLITYICVNYLIYIYKQVYHPLYKKIKHLSIYKY